MKKEGSAFVCLSGGLDSSVSLYWACENFDKVEAVFFNYNQKALENERKASKNLCKTLNVTCYDIDLEFLGEVSKSSLNRADEDLPENIDLDSDQETKDSADSVWVPNRNGLFINVAASIAEAKGFNNVVVGFNVEEAKTFPDNSFEFVNAINQSLSFSTKSTVKVVSPTISLNKTEIMKLGVNYGLDMESVWPCYTSGERICGVCESCQRFLRAKKTVA